MAGSYRHPTKALRSQHVEHKYGSSYYPPHDDVAASSHAYQAKRCCPYDWYTTPSVGTIRRCPRCALSSAWIRRRNVPKCHFSKPRFLRLQCRHSWRKREDVIQIQCIFEILPCACETIGKSRNLATCLLLCTLCECTVPLYWVEKQSVSQLWTLDQEYLYYVPNCSTPV